MGFLSVRDPVALSDRRLSVLIATWFGMGRLSPGQGTWAAASALPLHWWLAPLGPEIEGAAVLGITLIGWLTSSRAAPVLGGPDPQTVVIDEVAGVMIALWSVGGQAVGSQILAFVLFRAFDIVKLWPISRFERLSHDGTAIMADDVAAGIMAALVIALFQHFLVRS